MTKTIARLFDNFDDARSAVAELEAFGVAHAGISILNSGPVPVPAATRDMTGHETPGLTRSSGARDALVGSLIQAGVSEADAPAYAEGVHRGATLVIVQDDVRYAQAEAVLRNHNGVDLASQGAAHGLDSRTSSDSGEPHERGHEPTAEAEGEGYSISDDPAPLSHLLHIPVLSDD